MGMKHVGVAMGMDRQRDVYQYMHYSWMGVCIGWRYSWMGVSRGIIGSWMGVSIGIIVGWV